MNPPSLALSIKQPWATLIVAGLKSIEVRSWSTRVRGRLWIHAGRLPDTRDIAWNLLPADWRPVAEHRGGVIGEVNFTECRRYRSATEFDADRPFHLNDPSWFQSSGLYGFVMTAPKLRPFFRFPGWFKFFEIPGIDA